MQKQLNLNYARLFIRNLSKTMNKKELAACLQSYAIKHVGRDYKKNLAEELVRIAKPADIIPDVYEQYRTIIHDGILFLFSNLCSNRLMNIFIDQVLMDNNAKPEARLIQLAVKVPTLHKLGQVIARNRNIHPDVKKWLILLENGIQGTDLADIKEMICEQTANYAAPFSINLDDKILSEASVGAVTGFTWIKPDSGSSFRGVFKVIKPNVKEYLQEEFRILDKLAVYFEQNRDSYVLKDFRFVKTFEDIKQALQEEINLCGEQANIRQAYKFYKNEHSIKIPRLLRLSNEQITAMELVDGKKITDFPMNESERKSCARILFRTLIWKPLFSGKDISLFHGDPHAGNIYAVKTDSIKPVLLDWSLAGTLTGKCRIKIIRLILTIFFNDESKILKSVKSLAENITSSSFSSKLKMIVGNIRSSQKYTDSGFLEKAFYFIDQLAINGVGFSKDLLLFRKAFFTLDGVLHELDPEFNMDKYMFGLFKEMFIRELPKRWLYYMIPRMDCSENYTSLISTRELQLYAMQLFANPFSMPLIPANE